MEKTFKPSIYNFFIPEDRKNGNTLLFNGLRSSLIRLPGKLQSIVQNVLSLKHIDSSIVLPKIGRPLFNMLIEGGFIVDSFFDELNIIEKRFQSSKKGGPLHLIIAPTLNCNLACTYCYQSHSRGIMTMGICDRIIGFVREKLKKDNITDIRVDWYGGEPLLVPEIISYLSGHFLNLSKKFKCRYEAMIATNGTLLNSKAIDMLISNKVKSCQVTVDGPREIHDKRRGYKHVNSSSFNRILKNIKKIIGKMELSIRINIDADNMQYAYSLLDLFKKEDFFRDSRFGFFPYMASVGHINPSMSFNCKPVNKGKFYEYNLEFQKRVFEYSGKRQLSPIFDFPFTVNMACGGLRENSYAFDPEGYFFKCGLEIGENNKRCGHVCGETNWKQYRKWDEYNPLDDKECLRCRYLPFCMGACPKVEFDKNDFYSKDGCVYWKKNLENIITSYLKAKEEVTEKG